MFVLQGMYSPFVTKRNDARDNSKLRSLVVLAKVALLTNNPNISNIQF